MPGIGSGSGAFLTPGSGMGKKSSGPEKEAEERARLSTESEGSEPTSQVQYLCTQTR
jgi:hypothetical protein